MEELEDLFEQIRSYHPNPDLDRIERAYRFALDKHKDQKRKSGEPYIIHPIEVSKLVARLRLDEDAISAAMLHDVVEDTETTCEELAELFNPKVAELVDGLTKLAKIKFRSAEQKQAENFRKMLMAMSKDKRVILIKLCDRVHNMRTLEFMRPDRQEAIAKETLEIYAPLANRMGIHWLKVELEDLSLKYLFPEVYRELSDKIGKTRRDREDITKEIITELGEHLAANNVSAEVYGRPKHFYSIYRKMLNQQIDFNQVYDLVAFRVIVDTVNECYAALGHVHTLWTPIPGRFRDYVAVPKANEYQSIHTTVFGPRDDPIEIQIRTHEMHRVAEYGVAAHWKYKEGGQVQAGVEDRFNWLKQLLEWGQDVENPTEFLDSLKVDLFSYEVFIFTPKGEVKVLPKGASPVDFAFSIHSEVGYHCVGARVNGKLVPLDYELRNGNIVEVLTNKRAKPNQDWLGFLKTPSARTKVKNYLKREERDTNIAIGKDHLDRRLKDIHYKLDRFVKDKRKELNEYIQASGAQDLDEIYEWIGRNRLKPDSLIQRLLTEEEKSAGEKPAEGFIESLISKFSKDRSGIHIDGIDDVMVTFAKCCNPVAGDDIVGYVTVNRGITVHLSSCPNVGRFETDRVVDVRWGKYQGDLSPVDIKVATENVPGVLASITSAISNNGVNITRANCVVHNAGSADCNFQVLVKNKKQLGEVMRSIRKLKGIYAVERLVGT